MRRNEIIDFRTVRNVPEILNTTFDFVRQNFRVFWRSLLFFAFPPMLIGAVVLGYYFVSGISRFRFLSPSMDLSVFDWLAGLIGATMIAVFLCGIGVTVMITVVHEIVDLYRKHGPDNFSLSDVWEGVRSNFRLVFFTNIGLGIVLITINVISLIIPFGSFGIYALYALGFLYFPLRIFDRRGFLKSFVLSSSLIRGRFWATIGLIFLLSAITFQLSILFTAPMILAGFLGHFLTFDPARLLQNSRFEVFFGVLMVIYSLASFLPYSVWFIAAVVHFYSQRERHECPELLELVETIGSDADGNASSLPTGGFVV